MALLDQDLSIAQGEDWSLTWVWASPDPSGQGNLANAVYYDFTGCLARLQVRETQSSSALLLLALPLSGGGITFSSVAMAGGPPAPATPNAFTVTIPKATSLALPVGEFYYDMFIDWTNGTSTAMLQGQFVIAPTVTR